MNNCKRSNIILTQKTGQSMLEVMSQKAVTDLLDKTDSKFTELIEDEKQTRTAADNLLLKLITGESEDRRKADESLRQSITSEREARIEEDEHLQSRIETVDSKFADYPKLSNGLIPSSYLPSYVDDVLEFDNLSAFPRTGESGKIYVTKDTNLTYRWTGSTYIEISKSLALGETSSTAYAGDKGKALADKLSTIEEGAQVNVPAFNKIQAVNGTSISAANTPTVKFMNGPNIETTILDGGIYFSITNTPILNEEGKIPDRYLSTTSGSSEDYIYFVTTLPGEGQQDKLYVDTFKKRVYIWSDQKFIQLAGNEHIETLNTLNTTVTGIKDNISDLPEMRRKLGTIQEGAQKNVPSFTTVTDGDNTHASSSNINILGFNGGEGVEVTIPEFVAESSHTIPVTIGLSEDYTFDSSIAILYDITTTDYKISKGDRDKIFNGIIPKRVVLSGGMATENGTLGVVTSTIDGNNAYLLVLGRDQKFIKFTLNNSKLSVDKENVI